MDILEGKWSSQWCIILCTLLSLVSKEACVFLADTICITLHFPQHPAVFTVTPVPHAVCHPHELFSLQDTVSSTYVPAQMSRQTATPLLSSTLQSPSVEEVWALPLEEAPGLGSTCGIHLCLEVRSMMRVKHIFIKSCCCLVAKSSPTLCDPRNCSLPELSVHVVLRYSCLAQARILLV